MLYYAFLLIKGFNLFYKYFMVSLNSCDHESRMLQAVVMRQNQNVVLDRVQQNTPTLQ